MPLRLAAAAGLLAALALASPAQAQPYWDEVVLEQPPVNERSHWNVELRIGPYYPGVDDEFRDRGSDERPFETTFGDGPLWLTRVSLDHFFVFPGGQLGITGSVGFLGKKKNAFAVDSEGNIEEEEDVPVRSPGDKTAFRMIPTSLGAVYRATSVDEELGIPFVPYAKASLAYYFWWFEDPSGGIAEAATIGCMNAGEPGAMCEGDRATGGTLGVQASLGIAVRAERLDPSAEASLRNQMGIEHAGFFIEAFWARVDGLGASNKLVLSDATWFGGINFEF